MGENLLKTHISCFFVSCHLSAKWASVSDGSIDHVSILTECPTWQSNELATMYTQSQNCTWRNYLFTNLSVFSSSLFSHLLCSMRNVILPIKKSSQVRNTGTVLMKPTKVFKKKSQSTITKVNQWTLEDVQWQLFRARCAEDLSCPIEATSDRVLRVFWCHRIWKWHCFFRNGSI